MILPACMWKYPMFLDLPSPCLALPDISYASLVTELTLAHPRGRCSPDRAPLGQHMFSQTLKLILLVRGLAQGPDRLNSKSPYGPHLIAVNWARPLDAALQSLFKFLITWCRGGVTGCCGGAATKLLQRTLRSQTLQEKKQKQKTR